MTYSRLGRMAIAAIQPLRRTVLSRRVGRLVCERVEGIDVVVLPEVFNPAIFRSSDVLVRAVRAIPASAAPRRVLDLGTGTGIGALAAALLGHVVIAVDVNPAAVRCARMNAIMHGLDDRIEVRGGDLFAPVPGERFDMVLFNPPFFAGEPRTDLERAWRSVDVPERFAQGLDAALAQRGVALVVVSSHGGEQRTVGALTAAGFAVTPALVADLGDEIVTIVRAERPREVEGA